MSRLSRQQKMEEKMQGLQQMFSSLTTATNIWLQVALFAALIGMRIGWPRRIEGEGTYQFSVVCLTLSVILQPLLSTILGVLVEDAPRDPSAVTQIFLSLPTLLPTFFLGIGIFLAASCIGDGEPSEPSS